MEGIYFDSEDLFFACKACGSADGIYLGALGKLQYVRCCECGLDNTIDPDKE